MMNDSTSQVRQNWERPALYRLDAADAQTTTTNPAANDGMAAKS
jgi:hypothetical protein